MSSTYRNSGTREDGTAILNVRTAPLSRDQPDHTDKRKAGAAEAAQP